MSCVHRLALLPHLLAAASGTTVDVTGQVLVVDGGDSVAERHA